MTNQFVCSSYRVYLGYVTKTGTSYTFTKEVSKPVSVYSGVWYGVDKADVDYDSEVETYQGCSLQIKGLVNGWMTEFWGEVIVKGVQQVSLLILTQESNNSSSVLLYNKIQRSCSDSL
ncbi:MAG: hypothetical protein IPH69_02515 [Bacteroidales bacterium]|nr:hypothetical protein [Bacteroidales bacterium]